MEQDKLVKSRIERKLQRELTVRGAGGKEDRPVVLMKVCVGDRLLEEEFSLRDRDEMNYPVLLGRRTLEKLGPVDSAHLHHRAQLCGSCRALNGPEPSPAPRTTTP